MGRCGLPAASRPSRARRRRLVCARAHGRAVLRTLHPYMAAELGDRFDLDRTLRHGLVTLIQGADDPADVLRGYAALYLKEEVQLQGLFDGGAQLCRARCGGFVGAQRRGDPRPGKVVVDDLRGVAVVAFQPAADVAHPGHVHDGVRPKAAAARSTTSSSRHSSR